MGLMAIRAWFPSRRLLLAPNKRFTPIPARLAPESRMADLSFTIVALPPLAIQMGLGGHRK